MVQVIVYQYKTHSHTSLVVTFKIFDAAKKISGAGFKFSKASAETIASNLEKEMKEIKKSDNY